MARGRAREGKFEAGFAQPGVACVSQNELPGVCKWQTGSRLTTRYRL